MNSITKMSVEIKGPPAIKIDRNDVSLRFSENLSRRNLLEVLVNHWDDGTYRYREVYDLSIGAGINLYYGNITLASGTIISLAPSFKNGGISTFKFTVDVKRIRQSVNQEVHLLEYGKELLEFYPVLS